MVNKNYTKRGGDRLTVYQKPSLVAKYFKKVICISNLLPSTTENIVISKTFSLTDVSLE